MDESRFSSPRHSGAGGHRKVGDGDGGQSGLLGISGAQVTCNEFTFGSLTGWSYYDPSGTKGSGTSGTYYVGTLTPTIIPAYDPDYYQYFPDGAPEGNRVGIAFNFAGSGGTGEYGLLQTLSATLQANTQYTLTALVGNIAAGYSVDNSFFNLDGFPGYRIDLLAGGVVIASDNNSLAGTIAEGAFAQSSTVFTNGSEHPLLGQALGIRLVNLNIIDPSFPGADLEVDFDMIPLDASPIPEPHTALPLIGTLALAPLR